MKLAIAFLLFVLSHLPAGSVYALAGPGSGNISSACIRNVDDAQGKGVNRMRCYILANDNGHSSEDTFLAAVDDDDEETISRKYLSVTGYFLAFSWSLISSDRFAFHTERPFISHYLSCTGSCIYIAQRVLRI